VGGNAQQYADKGKAGRRVEVLEFGADRVGAMIEAERWVSRTAQVGVDVGGTFTDAALVHDGCLFTAKVPTTPDDQGRGVIAAVTGALERAGLEPGDIERFTHGMTVGTNALLEGTGVRTGLIATEGFGDLLELRRQDRPHLYRLDVAHPPALVATDDVIEVRERCGPSGVIAPLTDIEIARVVDRVVERDVAAVAICLLFSYAHPDHELRIASALRARLPHLHVSASCEVLAEIREYERASTTVIDATLGPLLGDYLRRLADRARAAGLPTPQIMLSNGGIGDLAFAADHAAVTVLSGPAAGVIGASRIAADLGVSTAISFDMGGTSCDVALISEGQPGRAAAATVNGHPIHLPMIDVETVSAGGGSIAWADSGGALRVGPQSAGALPGPAAYGYGGREPTVTDANVVLGPRRVIWVARSASMRPRPAQR
jgi:N-methylhydantoinase A